MIEAPPTMPTEPLPPKERSDLPIWIALALGFLLLIGLSNYNPPKEKNSKEPPRAFVGKATEIRGLLMTNIVSDRMTPGTSGNEKRRSELETQLQSILKEVKPQMTKDTSAAAVGLFVQQELGQPLDDRAVDLLRRSDRKSDVKIAEVYADATLEPISGEELFNALVNGSATAEIASYHALVRSGAPNAAERFVPLWRIGGIFALGGSMLFGLLLGIGAWAAYALLRQKLPPVEHPTSRLTRWEGAMLALGSLIVILVFQIFVGLGAAIVSATQGGDVEMSDLMGPIPAASALLFIVALFAFTKVFRIQGEPLWNHLHRPRVPKGQLFWWGLLGWAANIPVLVMMLAILMPLIQRMNPSHPATEALQSASTPLAILSLFVVAAVVAPVWEEIGFRGFLQGGLGKRMPWVWAGLISSFCFAAIHPQGPAMWLMLGWIGFMGVLLTMHTRSIVPAILMHALHNGMIMALGVFLS